MKAYRIIILFLVIVLPIWGAWEFIDQQDPDAIKVGYLPCDHSAALFVAKNNQTYEKNGLKVKTTQISTGSNIVDAVASGDLDIGYVGITPTLQGISKGIPIKVVGAVNLVGSGIVVEPNSSITSPADLKNKTIATPGVSSIQQVLLMYELQKYNITSADVDIISMNVYNIPSTLAAHKVDAYISYEPFVSIAPYMDIGEVLIYSNYIIEGHPCCVIITSEKFINEHPDELQKFLEIHQNSTEYVRTHPNETAEMVTQELTTNYNVETMSLQHIIFVSSVDKEFQDNVLRFMALENNMGYLKKNLTSDEIFDTSFLGG
ncbi:ABC transporter substrate-binding protein [Methanobacterium formicicum]|uniref:Aliphatic sulfonates family ABC transporter periplasmic ligand-binding protein n=1 Tax=Methanobacterium formicicum TaxID=2162 RepID=A0A089Z838_METFO|nr:ABC transporter substrate-binding protein [Methanobacterium formicicum]AIS30956.1 nitrate/sulfonate/bicarbonate ABC transporter substrate-binding protein [Methanobacterium formicicum]CEL23745.1 aliphatic sulfonates family ABC transporter periplasmic ligand-binding protein [Methanobacterium formicicum]